MPDASSTHSPVLEMNLPHQDLAKLTFCASNKPARLQQWVEQLQAIRITHTSIQLYRSLPEIARLKTDARTRLNMLDIVRPSVYNNLSGLARQFLGQPLILPEAAQKAAIVAQALQNALITGYSVCVRQLMEQKTLNAQGRTLLATAIYRALSSIGSLHLRSCQIYSLLPAGLWLHAHQLYTIACQHDLAATLIPDDQLRRRKSASIHENYLRTLMLACANTNQLGQQDMQLAFEACETWSPLMRANAIAGTAQNGLFAVNLSRDLPPAHSERVNADGKDPLLELDFGDLVTALRKTIDGTGRNELVLPQSMSSDLLQHLASTWSLSSDRQQQRQQVKRAVDVCLGLTECHYHLAGGQTLENFTASGNAPAQDDWFGGFTPANHRNAGAEPALFKPSRVAVENVSAGGYCLYWEKTVPAHAVAGQLIGIRDLGHKQWHLGVIRWVRQLRGASQMGVQIIAQHATPAAAAVFYDMGGESDPARVLQVAPGASDWNTATLITAAALFQEHSRVRLMDGQRTLTVKLSRPSLSTTRIRQFGYQVVNSESGTTSAKSPNHSASRSSDFDSQWDD